MIHAFIQDISKNNIIPLYGAKRVIISTTLNLTLTAGSNAFSIGQTLAYPNTIAPLEFPVINGKSPSYLQAPKDLTGNAYVRVIILELGGVPSDDYWDL